MSGSVTKLRQKQITGSIDMSTTAVDAVTIGSGLLSASNLQEDLNNVRALFKDIKGTTAWYGNTTYQLTGSAAHGSAIALYASDDDGGIDIDSGADAAITIDAGAAISLDAGAASNFTTSVGALTLDGKTGVTISEDGTAVISVDTGRNVTIGVAGTQIQLSGTVSDFALSGTIKNSAAKVIVSSVATEIETSAGALTLDGKTGINLQENGTTVISIDNGRNVMIGAAGTQIQLSGTVSDFALSGTIKSSAAKVIQSSAATEIETTAGVLTIDGKTGVNLQVNGTQVLGVGASGLYISGNVSSFIVTGAIRSPAATGVRFPEGISGSITRLSSGKSFIEAGSNILVTSGSNTGITIGVTGINVSPTGSKARNFYDVTGTYANGSEVIIHGNGATSQTGFNNLKARHDPYGSLDVYLNGQYMQSGTSAANGDYSIGPGCTTTGSIKFFFNLEQGDVITTFEINR